MKNSSDISKKLFPVKIFWATILAAALFQPLAAQSSPVPSSHGSALANAGPDISAIDTDAAPCHDFYQYACGNWLKKNSIPPDHSSWGRFSDFFSDNDLLLQSLMEEASKSDHSRTRAEQLVGDYYGACIHETALRKQGSASLQAELQAIGSLTTRLDVTRTVARLHSLGLSALFITRVRRGMADSSRMIAEVDAGGTTLPGRDYYLRDDAQTAATREKYLEHVQRTFQLAGDNAARADIEARAVLKVETALAKASLDLSDRRDPKNLDNIKTVDELTALVPAIQWHEFFRTTGAPTLETLNVAEPEFFKAMNALLETESKDVLRSYLRWQVIDFFSPALSEDFAQEDFNFTGKVLGGRQEIESREKRCMDLVNQQLSDAVGQIYVARILQSNGKAQVLKILQAEKSVLLASIQSASWMNDDTKHNAIIKLDATIQRIGYPDTWQDYSSLRVAPGNLFQSYANASRFLVQHQFAKLGKPASDREWSMPPQRIDASYNPQENTLNFPAGILRPPFYDYTVDLAVNFGAIGVVIGHELTHGFDDEGRKFDLHGNLHDWWSEADSRQFDQRAQCFVDEYNDFEVLPRLKANGKLTLGENIADNAGVRLAYSAWLSILDDQGKAELARRGPDGLTPVQRFFLTYAQIWCQNMSEAYVRQRTLNNEHSLPPLRVNGVVQNMPEFAAAFSCEAKDKMVRRPACILW